MVILILFGKIAEQKSLTISWQYELWVLLIASYPIFAVFSKLGVGARKFLNQLLIVAKTEITFAPKILNNYCAYTLHTVRLSAEYVHTVNKSEQKSVHK